MQLENLSIHAWLQEHQIKTETGAPLDFRDHLYMYDIYSDFAPKLCMMKAAQVTATTCEILKSLWGVKNYGLEAIYTLPTEADVNAMVGSKVNRLIAQNPILQSWTKDKDTIIQKQIGDNFIHYKGTWTEKAAIMVPSDWNLYDEVDASKQAIIEQYATRLQHSKYRWEHYFSHPSAEGYGVDKIWQISDQRHWHIYCEACKKWQYLSWPDSIDERLRQYVCKTCRAPISDKARRLGKWVRKFKDREVHGYWIPLLICPWVSAEQILDYFKNKSEEYFFNKVLGLPWVGGGNKLTKAGFMRNLTKDDLYPDEGERVVIGADTGSRCHYVMSTQKGAFHYGYQGDYTYTDIEDALIRWPRSIAVIDQGGDITGPRVLRDKYKGRVFLCSYGTDRKGQSLIRWGKHDEGGSVIVDRNRMIQWVVDEYTRYGFPVMGNESDWYDFWLHWSNLTRVKELNEVTGMEKMNWVRNGDDHWAHANVYCRVGLSRFGSTGMIIKGEEDTNGDTAMKLGGDIRVQSDILKRVYEVNEGEEDWRN